MPANAVNCVLCGAGEFAVLYPAGVAQLNQIVTCKRCGLMYANPRQQVDCFELEAQRDDWDFAERNPQRHEKEKLQVRDYATTRSFLSDLHPTLGRIIEVGSSCGFQLDAFRKDGWEVLGIEPDRNAAREATAKLGIRTINSVLEAARLPSEYADAVLMLHVIEHMPEPMVTLREVFRVLKPGGHLVLETPRYDTLAYKLLGRRERSLSCDGHIFFFTTDSLRRAYSKAGFELVQLSYVGRTMTLDRLAYNLGVMSKSKAVQRFVNSISRRLYLHKVRVHFNARDMQRVCLVKPLAEGLAGMLSQDRAGKEEMRFGARP